MRIYLYSSLSITLYIVISVFYKFDLNTAWTLVGLLSATFLLAEILFSSIHEIVGVSYLFFSWVSIYKFLFAQKNFPGFPLEAVVGFESLVAQSFIYLTLLVVIGLKLKKNFIQLFIFLVTIDALVVLAKAVFRIHPWFMLNNPAIDAAFIGIMLPFVFKKSKPLALLCIASLISTITSTAFLALFVNIAGFMFYNVPYIAPKRKLMIRYVAPVILFFVPITGIYLNGQDEFGKLVFFNSSGRYEIWNMAMSYFATSVNKIMGAGLGTFYIFGPALQMTDAIKKGLGGMPGFFWMHNDWLQVLFESGIVGFFLLLMTYLTALAKSFKKPEIFVSLCVYGSVSMLQMPLRWFPLSLLGVYLIKYSFKAS